MSHRLAIQEVLSIREKFFFDEVVVGEKSLLCVNNMIKKYLTAWIELKINVKCRKSAEFHQQRQRVRTPVECLNHYANGS